MPSIDTYALPESLNLYTEKYYPSNSDKVKALIKQNEKHIDDLDVIKNLLIQINNARKETENLDFSAGDRRALVDEVYKINPNLISGYKWKKTDIEGLVENLNNESKLITSRLNPINLEITEVLQQRNRVTEIMTDIQRTCSELMSYITQNMKKN
jgi:hypothetical protein